MKSAVSIAVILILAVPSLAVDLQVLDLQYTGGRLVANVFNQAPDGTEDGILVRFYDNGREIGSKLYTDPLPRYSVFSVYMDYTPPAGLHDFMAVADPDNAIAESKDDNNDKIISFEQKLDTTPRNVTPEVSQQQEPPSQPVAPITFPEIRVDGGTMPFMAALLAVLLILLAARLLQKRGKLRISLPKKKSEKAEEKTGRHSSVADALKLGPGTTVQLRARLSYNGVVGGEHTYFIRDAGAEAVGVSEKKLPEKECTLTCSVESFMKTDKILRIKDVK
ncbi:MAG: hypothetical protein HYT73_04915 [Candidatus Aenigmarchaeota archaeon]|nr:hypothetical protein [Candidatus Aenigmarchaeota archaeon]